MSSNRAIFHKEKMKNETEQKNAKQEFMVGDLVLVDSSGVPCLPSKLKSKWTGPYLITQVFPHGAVELKTKEGVRFKVNRERIKLCFGHIASVNELIEAYNLDEGCVIKSPQSCRDVKSGACWEATQYLLFFFFLVMVAFFY